MRRGVASRIVCLLVVAACGWAAEHVVVDFARAVPLGAEQKANRFPRWEEKGVVFTLAHEPRQSSGKGLLMFFTHLASGRKGLVSAMATEPIPVRATFPAPVSAVTMQFWASTATPAVLEAFDANGKLLDRVEVAAAPGRKSPGEAVPVFPMSVKGERIAWIQFSGPRAGEFLVADELRFTPAEGGGAPRGR